MCCLKSLPAGVLQKTMVLNSRKPFNNLYLGFAFLPKKVQTEQRNPIKHSWSSIDERGIRETRAVIPQTALRFKERLLSTLSSLVLIASRLL
ncbi:hypothetical protein CDAR_310531 [Caerostris darwini]|uniref:Uncharacterized protein n=1 Tax=Caerostris darwini TaxID=1538125 RepID=A0AAV4M6N2_9ARAC|nr:hypothetical protein CDAR_310531 [Caerostris darwini]